ncbi:MAG: Txe/YoeB family addiction module toxin [Beijerinckiaceae bacterium]|nr:Txe/YoeB family addiction module toxin [Beijerinckiaceae bacterium]
MRLIFSEKTWDDYLYWQSADPKLVKRINELIKDCMRSPFIGIGKPEPLRGPLSGWWSRRMTQEHRLVYRVLEDGLLIAQCRYHY